MKKDVSLFDLYFSFFKIGLFTFGGGLAMIPMLEKEIVDKRNWCTTEEIMDYYAVGQCTPGIIAVNTATFVGYKYHGVLGGIMTTLGVITPSLVIITLIATFLKNFANNEIVIKALKGLGAGVCAVIVPSIIKMFKASIKTNTLAIIAICAFIAVEFIKVPVYIVVIVAIIIGLIMTKWSLKKNDIS